MVCTSTIISILILPTMETKIFRTAQAGKNILPTVENYPVATGAVKASTLIINTTPVGMHPKVEDHPALPYEGITERHLLYDLVYNPEETKFLTLAKERGATIKNGLEMLHLQAEASWRIWNNL